MLIAAMVAMLLAQDGPYKIANGVSQPILIRKVEPAYSKEAQTVHLVGMVGASNCWLRWTEPPTAFKVMKSLGLGLDEKAIEAVQQWRFQPGKKDGTPVPVIAKQCR